MEKRAEKKSNPSLVALDHSSECEDLINNLIMQVC
jgi:hypothetical protein